MISGTRLPRTFSHVARWPTEAVAEGGWHLMVFIGQVLLEGSAVHPPAARLLLARSHWRGVSS